VSEFQKDKSLDELAQSGNVAQFVSFAPDATGELSQRYSRVAGFGPNHHFESLEDAVGALFAASPEQSINLRSFEPTRPQSRDFHYGLRDVRSACEIARSLGRNGLYVIANETVDVADGGVSGVAQGELIEFAPGDTPRCVEKPGVASLPRALGLALLEMVYGFPADLGDNAAGRVEFSIHPKPRGWKRSHTILWEQEMVPEMPANVALRWPNRFSRFLGDKLYGLLVAHTVGLPVPRTQAICRHVAPFAFGAPTGSHEVWIRTCPTEPEPGRYSTFRGWRDPFALLAKEDLNGGAIPSVLCQASVPADFAGAAIHGADGLPIIEGSAGFGDEFMLGRKSPQALPLEVTSSITALYERAVDILGPCRFEWVYDGTRTWIVQLHAGSTDSLNDVVVPGNPSYWANFDAVSGLEELRKMLNSLPEDTGVDVSGDVGMTSHIADLLRKSKRPSKLTRACQNA
jgi:hypothetical protein